MPTIRVAKPFTLSLDPQPLGQGQDEGGRQVTVYQGEPEKRRFDVGEHDVPDEIAAHWFVKAHLEGAVEQQPQHMLYQQAVPLAEQAARQPQRIQQPPEVDGIPPADVPRGAPVASRGGEVQPGAHYFAGQPQVDKPAPGQEPGVGFLPPSPPKPKQPKKGEE